MDTNILAALSVGCLVAPVVFTVLMALVPSDTKVSYANPAFRKIFRKFTVLSGRAKKVRLAVADKTELLKQQFSEPVWFSEPDGGKVVVYPTPNGNLLLWQPSAKHQFLKLVAGFPIAFPDGLILRERVITHYEDLLAAVAALKC